MDDGFLTVIIMVGLILGGVMIGCLASTEQVIAKQKQIEQLEQERDTYKQIVLDKLMLEE